MFSNSDCDAPSYFPSMRHLRSMNKACSPLREPDAVLLTGFDVLVLW
jgi:hypothetical protein